MPPSCEGGHHRRHHCDTTAPLPLNLPATPPEKVLICLQLGPSKLTAFSFVIQKKKRCRKPPGSPRHLIALSQMLRGLHSCAAGPGTARAPSVPAVITTAVLPPLPPPSPLLLLSAPPGNPLQSPPLPPVTFHLLTPSYLRDPGDHAIFNHCS